MGGRSLSHVLRREMVRQKRKVSPHRPITVAPQTTRAQASLAQPNTQFPPTHTLSIAPARQVPILISANRQSKLARPIGALRCDRLQCVELAEARWAKSGTQPEID